MCRSRSDMYIDIVIPTLLVVAIQHYTIWYTTLIIYCILVINIDFCITLPWTEHNRSSEIVQCARWVLWVLFFCCCCIMFDIYLCSYLHYRAHFRQHNKRNNSICGRLNSTVSRLRITINPLLDTNLRIWSCKCGVIIMFRMAIFYELFFIDESIAFHFSNWS